MDNGSLRGSESIMKIRHCGSEARGMAKSALGCRAFAAPN
jgi:hypothetical protein